MYINKSVLLFVTACLMMGCGDDGKDNTDTTKKKGDTTKEKTGACIYVIEKDDLCFDDVEKTACGKEGGEFEADTCKELGIDVYCKADDVWVEEGVACPDGKLIEKKGICVVFDKEAEVEYCWNNEVESECKIEKGEWDEGTCKEEGLMVNCGDDIWVEIEEDCF